MFKYTHRKPDPLKLLAIVVTIAVLTTSAVDAAEPFKAMSFNESLGIADLADGDLMLTPVGRQGAGIHMSYQGNTYQHDAVTGTSLNNQRNSSSPAVFLSVRVPW